MYFLWKSCQSNSYFQESQYEKSNGLDVNTIKIWVDLLPKYRRKQWVFQNLLKKYGFLLKPCQNNRCFLKTYWVSKKYAFEKKDSIWRKIFMTNLWNNIHLENRSDSLEKMKYSEGKYLWQIYETISIL